LNTSEQAVNCTNITGGGHTAGGVGKRKNTDGFAGQLACATAPIIRDLRQRAIDSIWMFELAHAARFAGLERPG
jgi:hypothetical protein